MSTPTLTLEQQFQYVQMKQAAENLSIDQLVELLVDALRQLQIKTNAYISLCNSRSISPSALELTLEESLKLRLTKEELRTENRQGLQDRLLETMQLLMHRDNDIKKAAFKSWQI